MTVNLDQDFHAERMSLCRQLPDKFKSLRNHETTRASLLDGIANRIQANGADAGLTETTQDRI